MDGKTLLVAVFAATLIVACGSSDGSEPEVRADGLFSCTEEGVRSAIAAEGTDVREFACVGETTVTTRETILIDRNVTLDGRGLLILDGASDHSVMRVASGVRAELRGLGIVNGSADDQAGGLVNEGFVRLVDSFVSRNRGLVGGIANYGELEIELGEIAYNEGAEVGGLMNDTDARTTIVTSVMYENEGNEAAGISNRADGGVEVGNSLVGGGCAGTVASVGGNVMDSDSGCGFDAELDRTTFLSDWHE